MLTVFGIKNCSTVKKALAWLDAHAIAYRFHDFRKDGIDRALLTPWVGAMGCDALLNKRGPTWRKIPEAERSNLDEERAIALMLEYPTLIRRPLLDLGERRYIGFDEVQYQQLFDS